MNNNLSGFINPLNLFFCINLLIKYFYIINVYKFFIFDNIVINTSLNNKIFIIFFLNNFIIVNIK